MNDNRSSIFDHLNDLAYIGWMMSWASRYHKPWMAVSVVTFFTAPLYCLIFVYFAANDTVNDFWVFVLPFIIAHIAASPLMFIARNNCSKLWNKRVRGWKLVKVSKRLDFIAMGLLTGAIVGLCAHYFSGVPVQEAKMVAMFFAVPLTIIMACTNG